MKYARRFFLALPLAAALGLALALPASATSNPVTVSEQVASSITITGLSASITFPQGAAGATENVPHAEVYSVSSNNPSGFTLTINPAGSAMADGGSATIPNSALSVTENGPGGSGTKSFSGSTPLLVDNFASSGSQNYDESWALAIPGTQPAGSYSETFTYTAIANP